MKRSAYLLLFLGLLFSLPIAAKTWSAHGAAPAFGTVLLVLVSVYLGPLSFVIADAIDTGFIGATATTSGTEMAVVLMLGLVLLLVWGVAGRQGFRPSAGYLPVTAWALLGAWCCISIVFSHTT